MPRTIKEEDYATRRNEILNAAQALLYRKGFEQVSIQDILDALGISKGAFYHYFSSKADLLEAIIDRIQEQGQGVVRPIVEDPALSALEKLEQVFISGNNWKTGQRDLMLALLHAWYADENALVRQKSTAAGLKWMQPLFTKMIEQGMREGVFAVPCAEMISPVVLRVLLGLGEGLAAVMLSDDQTRLLDRLEQCVQGYTIALERVLGAAPGSLHLMDREMLAVWVAPQPQPAV